MVDNGSLPAHDLYTYTVAGHSWTDHEYLSELLMWLIYDHAGLLGISVAFGAITWAGLYLIYRSSEPDRRPYVVVGLGLALAVVAGGPIWGPRAQMITFLLSCLELYWLRRYLARSSRAILWFPLVMAVWANLHGGWVVGFAFLGVAIVSELTLWLLDRSRTEHLVRARQLAVITALSVAAVAATPHGLALYLYPFQTQGSPVQQKLIVEWFSPDFHNNALRGFEAMVFLLIAGFALRRPSLYDLLLSLATLALALQSVRHVALFVAATTPILIAHLSEAWRQLSASRRWRLTAGVATSPLMTATSAVALLVIAGAVTLTVASGAAKQPKLTADDYPVAAADWLAAHPGVGTRMFNQYGWGGYLAFRFYPESSRRVFIFGEAALMGDDHLRRYQDVAALRPNWKAVLDEEGVDYVVFNKGEALPNVLATLPEWRLAYEDPVAVIYVRSQVPARS